jgi:hypothetical protein
MNIGPIHLLDTVSSEVYNEWEKTFMFKRLDSGAFASHTLKEYKMGAAVRNRRNREEGSSRFSTSFWTEKK